MVRPAWAPEQGPPTQRFVENGVSAREVLGTDSDEEEERTGPPGVWGPSRSWITDRQCQTSCEALDQQRVIEMTRNRTRH